MSPLRDPDFVEAPGEAVGVLRQSSPDPEELKRLAESVKEPPTGACPSCCGRGGEYIGSAEGRAIGSPSWLECHACGGTGKATPAGDEPAPGVNYCGSCGEPIDPRADCQDFCPECAPLEVVGAPPGWQQPPTAPLWEAVNEYAAACGGDTGAATVSKRREMAVVAVERAVKALQTPVTEAAVEAEADRVAVEALAERLYGAMAHAEATSHGAKALDNWRTLTGQAFAAAEAFVAERNRRRGK